jgi:HTH-type transcriptional regulator / antitoxin HipB
VSSYGDTGHLTTYRDIFILSSYVDKRLKSPYDDNAMDVHNLRDIAATVRGRRRELNLSQTALAARARVSRQWVGELEAGKASAEIGLVIRVLDALGLQLSIAERDAGRAADDAGAVDLDALLDEHRDP